MLITSIIGVLVIVFALPISETSRNQLLGLFGIVLSGIFAFSSTAIISNLMAGVLLRITQPFKVGDFIRIGESFGRVSERGLFETEIQTESRELISLPNVYCISNPLTTIRSSGTMISATLSLGYDVNHKTVEPLLMEAAEACGLMEPFVHILELGDFSVSYRVTGLLEEPKKLISAKSNLYASVLDTLHKNHIEIVSPGFVNQRKLDDHAKVIPVTKHGNIATQPEQAVAEDIIFDKAEQAEQAEQEKVTLLSQIDAAKLARSEASSDAEKGVHQDTIDKLNLMLEKLQEKPKKV
jgi:small-conductance mechanosensitive channel